MKKGPLYFGLICLVGLFISKILAMYIFSGLLTLAGFWVLVMAVPALQWLIYKWGRLMDLFLFAFTIYATISFGVTIAMALTVAGLGYTMVLCPYVRDTYENRHNND